jgi:hypothetical protein
VIRVLVLAAFCGAAQCDAASLAAGRNWRIAIESIDCDAAASLITLGTRIDYRGPKGPVEAPVVQLVDGGGKRYVPRSLVWTSGSKLLAQLLSTGGLRNIQSALSTGVQLRIEVRQPSGDLMLEFGDVAAFSLTRKRAGQGGACDALLKPGQIKVPRAPRAASAGKPNPGIRVYRSAYPCSPQPAGQGALRTIEAEYPPYLPRQLLLFGRGYLPNAREVELPMGKAPAQSYAYTGVEDLKPIDDATRRALSADFPEYQGSRYFVFSWGMQKAASSNDAYSIGVYELRPCPK